MSTSTLTPATSQVLAAIARRDTRAAKERTVQAHRAVALGDTSRNLATRSFGLLTPDQTAHSDRGFRPPVQAVISLRSKARSTNQINATSAISHDPAVNTRRR